MRNTLFDKTEEIQRVVDDHNLVYTDLRFNVGTSSGVADVIEVDQETQVPVIVRRLLIVSEGVESAELLWSMVPTTGRNYVVPKPIHDIENVPDNVRIYQLPTSSRLLQHETMLNNKSPRNLVGDTRIAESMGRLLSAYYSRTGAVVRNFFETTVLVDFLPESREPIMFVPVMEEVNVPGNPIDHYSSLSLNMSPQAVQAFAEGFAQEGQ